MSETLKLSILTGAIILGASLAAAPMAIAEGGPGARGISFEELDADGDGTVTEAELDAHRAARFAAMDSDGNGSLNAAELAAVAEQRKADRVARMIERIDTNDDGELSAEELAAMRDKRRGGGFERMDADRDGSISQAEFEAAQDKRRAHSGHRRGQNDG
ncbi:MAG: EF-hand domain-containing protein [Pseudomonadota bacterium]